MNTIMRSKTNVMMGKRKTTYTSSSTYLDRTAPSDQTEKMGLA